MKKGLFFTVLCFFTSIAFSLEMGTIETPIGIYGITVNPDPPGYTYYGMKRQAEANGYPQVTLPNSVMNAAFDYLKKEYSFRSFATILLVNLETGGYYGIYLNKNKEYVTFFFGKLI